MRRRRLFAALSLSLGAAVLLAACGDGTTVASHTAPLHEVAPAAAPSTVSSVAAPDASSSAPTAVTLPAAYPSAATSSSIVPLPTVPGG